MTKEELYELDLRYRVLTRIHRNALSSLVEGNPSPTEEAALINKIESLEIKIAQRESQFEVI